MARDWLKPEQRARVDAAQNLARSSAALSCGAALTTPAARTTADEIALAVAEERAETQELKRIVNEGKTAETDRLARERHEEREERRRSKHADDMTDREFRETLAERGCFRNTHLMVKR